MNYSILNDKIIIRKSGIATSVPKIHLEQLINNPILQYLTMAELVSIWNSLYGIPGNVADYLQTKIALHDKSPEVNSFIYKGSQYWFDKNTRLGLMNLATCSENTMSVVLGDELIEVNVEDFKKFLTNLELYASKCYLQTQAHLKASKQLMTVEDIINYDYTTGYPEKVVLE